MKLFVENFVATRRELTDKRQDGLTINCRIDTRVECPAEMHERIVYYHTEYFGLSASLMILIHMIYQAWIRSITFTLTRHIDQRLAEAL